MVKGFENLIATDPKTKAAQMAALHLSDLLWKYNSAEKGIEVLKKTDIGRKDLLCALVKVQLGTLLAEQKDCKAAVDVWDQVINNKEATFLHANVRLKQGLCYESLDQKSKAEEAYAKVKDEAKDTATARSAESYLRLLKAKTN